MSGILNGTSFVILLGTFGTSLFLSLRKGAGLVEAFERFALGYLVIQFHGEALSGLQSLGNALDVFIARSGSTKDLDALVAGTLAQAATAHSGSGIGASVSNLFSYTAQVVRTGVWGILASFTELLFLLARFVLEVGRDALWQITVVLFPLSAAALPVSPKVFMGMCLLALELVLWLPMLTIINISCSEVARQYMQIPEDIGFYVLALELVAISLTFAVPMMAHKFITGALQGTHLEPWRQTVQRAQSSALVIPSTASKVLKVAAKAGGASFVIIVGLLASDHAYAKSGSTPILLEAGHLKKLHCRGKLLVSGTGNEQLIQVQSLPPEIGCGVILKPLHPGRTNLILETTAESLIYELYVEERPFGRSKRESDPMPRTPQKGI